MNAIPNRTWQGEFGIDETSSPNFFANKADIELRDTPVPYAHIVRRAFDLLDLDGIWCDQNTPLVYFKLVTQIAPQEISDLHRRFWNHGGAAILVVISPLEVQIYSGLSRPATKEDTVGPLPSFVTSLNRASQALQEFLPAVESGEFFHKHAQSFDTNQRVDQALLFNLQATREQLAAIATEDAKDEGLDAFLCRLVFTCYLFDRGVIGASYLEGLDLSVLPHLRDILGLRPRSSAKEYLYRLFHKLAQDFNGDLFSDDLDAEADSLSDDHLTVVEDFFRATDVTTGQQAIWPYDFGVIPIETVSAIYERFLKPSDKKQGAFYTPRFLAELVLDIALSNRLSLLGLRFLDPACGSGIFLVGIFNRLAEEWRRENPNARNDQRARELMQLMRDSIFGVDLNPTACRITAFSLYLAYLDQLTPRDIQELQAKGNALPRLVVRLNEVYDPNSQGGIWCGDFFHENALYPENVDVVIGNPPWGAMADEASAATRWCEQQQLEVPNKQIAAAFMWKAAQHVSNNGNVCLILPHGMLFNQNPTAIAFQKAFLSQHALDRVLNLTDYQRFLFRDAEYPAVVLSYRRQVPDKEHLISYWFPKVDWKLKNADVISISEYDRSVLSIQSVLRDLEGEDALQIWKQIAWATPRDRRFLARLADLPRLRDSIRQANEQSPKKPWLIAAGFEPFGPNDDPNRSPVLELPTDLFIETSSSNLHLFLLEEDCIKRDSTKVRVRSRSNKTLDVFHAPHVLINQGFSRIAFSDFAVSFQLSLRGIVGPSSDRKLLMFLAAYLRSPLARYFLFHTSSKWGVTRQQVTVDDLLRLPFPWPDTMPDATRAKQIIEEVSHLVESASQKADEPWVNRTSLVNTTQAQIEPLIFEYFDIVSSERILIKDAIQITIPSFRPSAEGRFIPSIEPSSMEIIEKYTTRLCETLNNWATRSNYQVIGSSKRSASMGVGLVVLEKVVRGALSSQDNYGDILAILTQLRKGASTKVNTFELMRGVKVFDGNRLYILKPLGRRNWTETAALNDADEIASSILMQPSREPA
jgi:hypothetical protein